MECYERGLGPADYAEELYRHLMTLYPCQGRRPEALAVFQRYRTALAAKRRPALGRSTEALHHALRAG